MSLADKSGHEIWGEFTDMNPGSFCGSCGAAVKQGGLYCGSCGAPVVAAAGPDPAPLPVPLTMVGTVGGQPVPASSPPPSPADAGPTAWAGPVGFTGYASFGRRVGAYVIDAIPTLVITAIGYSALLAAFLGRSTAAASLSLIVVLAGPIVYFVVLWVMAAKGNSPGNALLGIRVVREASGGEPGAGLGLGRLLLKGLLIGITFYIGGFSPLWDSSGRRKGWWDSACGTVVLNRDAVQSYRAAVDGSQPPSLVAMSLTGQPERIEPSESAAEPVIASAPAVERVRSTPDDRPEWDIAPVAVPARRVSTQPVTTSVATWDDRPADPAAADPPAPSASTAVSAVSPWRAVPDPIQDLPWSDPAPTAVVIQGVPDRDLPTVEAEQEDLDHTRLRVTPSQVGGSGWLAELDDGRTLPLDGPVLLGRDPSARPEEPAAIPVPVADEGRSVSKTHLLLDAGPGGVQVTDRHSTNGVVVVTAGVDLRCVPGVPTPVLDGSTVRFGDRTLVVRRG